MRGATKSELAGPDYLFMAAIMGLLGALFWAIRGTGGFGGEQGAILAGLGWGVLWHAFGRLDGTSRQRPYGHAAALAAITFGIALGGFTGYGVYNSWVRGQFYLNHPHGLREVGAWTGYAMLFVCGLHWGGIAGVLMAWCAPRIRVGWQGWMARLVAGIAGVAAAALIVRVFPQWFLPFYGEGIYEVAANKTCVRALNSLHTIAPHVGLFLGFFAFEIARRDWRAVGVMLVMSLGFAIPFAVGGVWHTMYDVPLKIDWWKNWEMSIGLGGGLAFGLAFYLFNRPDYTKPPRPVTRSERLAGIGIPMVFAVASILLGAYDGFRALRKPDWPELPDVSAMLVVAGMVLVCLVLLRWRSAKTTATVTEEGTPVPAWVLAGAIGLIIAAGYLTSIPRELALANKLLLALYTGYLGVSMILFALLLLRRRATRCR